MSFSGEKCDHNKRKVGDISREIHASQSAIAALCADIRQNELPKSFSRPTQYRNRKEIASTSTPYGPLVQTVPLPLLSGLVMDMPVQHPMAMLYEVCRSSPGFSNFVRQSLEENPCTVEEPWRLVLYSDEVGVSPLKVDTRKVEAVYWTFLELGVRAFDDENAWFAVAAPRSTVVQQTGAGASTLFKVLWPFFLAKIIVSQRVACS